MRRIVVGILCLGFAGSAWAIPPLEAPLSARAVGMGGALRALARPAEAASLNPAAIGRKRGFFGGVSYLTRREDPFDALAIVAVDNATSPFGGAIQYLRLNGETDQERLSLGLAWGPPGQWWGTTVRYVHGRDPGETRWRDVVTADFAALFERPGGLLIGVVGYNLVDTALDALQPRLALAVASTALRPWIFEADLVRNLDRDVSRGIDLHLGMEYRVPRTPWRMWAGQMWRGDTGKDYASAGVGWEGSAYRAGYALQKARQRAGEWLHVFTVEGRF